jgi:hypothetical protein
MIVVAGGEVIVSRQAGATSEISVDSVAGEMIVVTKVGGVLTETVSHRRCHPKG